MSLTGTLKKRAINLSLAEPLQVTKIIADVFDRLQISYFVGGSLASSLHGIPRATQDVDLVADIKLQHVTFFVKALEKEFYIDADMIQSAIRHRSSFNVIHLATMFKADIFVLKDDVAAIEEMTRRKRYQISEVPRQELFLASAEDIILQKLHWYQLGEGISERQWNDALGVIRVQGERLDFSYLIRVAKHLAVADLLTQALDEANIEISR